MRGRFGTQPFLVKKRRSPSCRLNEVFLLPRWATRSPPHPSPSVTASPQGEASGLCSPTRKSVPNQGTQMGTVIAPRPEQCGTTAKTSEWEQAGHKKRGSRGQGPRRSFLRLSPEKAGLPPGVGRETTLQVWTCAGPNPAPLPEAARCCVPFGWAGRLPALGRSAPGAPPARRGSPFLPRNGEKEGRGFAPGPRVL